MQSIPLDQVHNNLVFVLGNRAFAELILLTHITTWQRVKEWIERGGDLLVCGSAADTLQCACGSLPGPSLISSDQPKERGAA